MCIRQRCRHSKCNHGLQAAWEVFDTDGDGLITSGDLCLLLKTYGFDHSEAEHAEYLKDLPINLEGDQALDKAQFVLWISKLREQLMHEDRDGKIEQETEIQDLVDSGTLDKTVENETREHLAQLKMDRAELEAIVEGELSAHEKALFDGLDQNCKGFLTIDDIHLLSKQVRFSL
jgi:hypothetical protein